MKKLIPLLFLSCSLAFLSQSCQPSAKLIDEEEDPAFGKGRSLLKVGKEDEALDQFLSITRRIVQCPKSHLECGRLLLTLEARKDPIAAIYHFRRFLLLSPDSRESSKVRQLIVSAEREIIRKLPGEPYGGYLDALALKEENEKFRRQVADLKARLGVPLNAQDTSETPSVPIPATPVLAAPISASPEPEPVQPSLRTYEVRAGDSLYGISRKIYGDSSHIERIFQANRDVMSSKNSLRVGQTLRIPPIPRNP
tara:strand:- start:8213 stop:8971 length:759 start_codon:yes stop_codon:yes gene_type:complete